MLLPRCSVMGDMEERLNRSGPFEVTGVLTDTEGNEGVVRLLEGGKQVLEYRGKSYNLTGKTIREVLEQSMLAFGNKATRVRVILSAHGELFTSEGHLDGNPEVITAHLRRVVRRASEGAQ